MIYMTLISYIIWADDGLVYWCTDASAGLDKLSVNTIATMTMIV